MDFSNRVIAARKAKGLSQEALADRIGVSRQAVSKWETGEAKPDVDKLIALCEALELSMDYLCLGKEPVFAEAPPVLPAPAAEKEPAAITVLRLLLVAAVAVFSIVVLFFSTRYVKTSTSGGYSATAQEVLDSYTIHSVRVESQGEDLTAAIVVSVAYEMKDMQMQLILEYENFPNMAPVILEPRFENGQFSASIPRQCYGYSFRVRALLTLGDVQRSVPLMRGLKVEEGSWAYEPIPIR